jgi:UDP:flavonoid glycosyltransferase YjiC (YdhE family)
MFPNAFAGVSAPRMLEDLLPLAGRWRPDLIVHEQAELSSPLVGAVLGVPTVTHGFGTAIPQPILTAAADRLAPLWVQHGQDMPPYAGCFTSPYLDPYPPSMQGAGNAHIPVVQLIRPVSYTGEEPDALPSIVQRDPRPLVYLTLGTVHNDPTLLGRLVAPLADLPIRLLVTVGPKGDPAALGRQPAHVAVERYVSQSAVLPHCDAVVSHAGSGTVLGALAVGLPLVCLPQAADQFRNSEAVARTGTGVVLRPDAVTPEALVAAVQGVLGADAYRRRATEAAAEIAAMPAPEQVVPVLEAVAAR